MVRLVFFLCVSLVSLGGAVQAQESAPLPWDAYWRLVDEALTLVQEGAPDDAVAAVERLVRVERVELPDGRVVPVDSGELAALVDQGAPDDEGLDRLRERLAALSAAGRALTGAPSSASDETFARLDAVLARSEFAPATPEQDSPLQRLVDALRRLVARWVRRVEAVPGGEYIIGLVAALVLLTVLAFLVRDGWRQWAAEGRHGGAALASEDENLTFSDALSRAQQFSAGGDFRHAVRYLYLSTLLWLDGHRLLSYDPALTNREVLAQTVGQRALYEALVPVVEGFERVWYGFAPLDGRGYAAYLRQVEQVRQMRRQG